MNFELVGLPPKDIVSSLAVALRRSGYDYDEVFQRCVAVSNEWCYNATGSSNLADRFSQKYMRERDGSDDAQNLGGSIEPAARSAQGARVRLYVHILVL